MLDFALQLRDKLEKTGKYRVAMTRNDDTFVPLAERVRLARAAKARAVHLDPCRRAAPARARGAGRDRLHAVGDRLGRRGRAARRGREQGRRDRRRRSDRRARRRRRHPDRPRAARDQDFLAASSPARWSANSRRRRGCTRTRSSRPASGCSRRRTCPRCWSNSAMCRTSEDLKLLTSDGLAQHSTADAIAQAVDTFFSTAARGRRLAGRAGGRN